MPKYVGAIDQGTTSSRFIIFDYRGNVVGSAQKEHKQIFPRPGWVEHDALEIWDNTKEVIGQALHRAGLKGSDLAAVGITNQRETTLVWDKNTGKPYHHAIVWQCTRTHEICKELMADGGQDRFRPKTGLPVATYFSGPKIKWVMDNLPEAKKALERGQAIIGTMETWIIWWLTGGPKGGSHVSDVTNASRTMLMDLSTLDWDPEIIATLGIPVEALPQIKPSSDAATWGTTLIDGPFGGQVPVCGALGDQQAALVGQACFEPGEAKNTYGTGCFLLLNTGENMVVSSHGLITTVAYQITGQKPVYALEGSIAIAGALVQWLRDSLCIIKTAPEVEELAAAVEDNGGVYCVPAFQGLFAPYWRPDARGVIVGLTRYADKRHIARAALEANAYQTLDIVQAMARDSGVPLSQLKVDGGMVANNLLMQFQADVLEVPVIRPKVSETTCLGAAYAAGLAVGFWENTGQLKSNWAMDKTWLPDMDPKQRQKGYAGWKKAVQRTLNWVD